MQTIAADPRITFTWSCWPKGCCIVVLFSFIYQSFKSIYSTLVIILTKCISTYELFFLSIQRNEVPYLIQSSFQLNEFLHLSNSFYYSNQMNFHIWFTLSIIPTKMNFHIWFTLYIIPTKWNSTSDLLFLLFEPNEFPHLIHYFYYSNQLKFHIWFTLFIIWTKWISPSDSLFLLFQPNEFP